MASQQSMQTPLNRLKTLIIIPVMLIMMALVGLGSFIFDKYQSDNWQQQLELQQSVITSDLDYSLDTDIKSMYSFIEYVSHNNDILQAFKAENRQLLLQYFDLPFANVREQSKVTHLHFIRSDGTSLLRVHQPDRYGDRIIRASMQRAMRTNSDVWGLEIGPLGQYTLRLVRPLFDKTDKQKVIGYLEMGMDIEHVLAQLETNHSMSLAMIIDTTGWPNSRINHVDSGLIPLENWRGSTHAAVAYLSDNLSADSLKTNLTQFDTDAKDQQLLETIDGKTYLTFSIPLGFDGRLPTTRNATGELVVLVDQTEAYQALIESNVYFLAVGAIIILLTIAFLFVYLRWVKSGINARYLESQIAILQSENELNAAQRIGRVGSWKLKTASGELKWSPQIYSLFEIDPARFDATYDAFLSAIHPDDRDAVNNAYAKSLIDKQPYEIEHRLLFPDGRIKWVEERCESEFDDKGQPVNSFGTVRDITELKEQQLKLMKALEAKDDFLASMSHELRTPLTTVIGNSEYLLDEEDTISEQEHHNTLKTIKSAAIRQLSLVNDILDVSKIASGKFSIEKKAFNLSLMLHELHSLLRSNAKDQNATLTLNQHYQTNYLLLGDQQRISQILINLVGNAIKFSNGGTVSLDVKADRSRLLFVVNDNGVGISEDALPRLFNRFEQADNSTSRRFGGSGLGLYISKNLAELMGGDITVESWEGEGSTFTLELPLEVTDQLVRSATDADHSPQHPQRFSGHVVLAEDTPPLQLLIKRMLEQLGVSVQIAANGQEVVNLLNSQPDLIFMDMQMPEMDGIEATRLIREMGLTIPVVALTANVMQIHKERFIDAGCNDFLGKPVRLNDLREVMANYLEPEK